VREEIIRDEYARLPRLSREEFAEAVGRLEQTVGRIQERGGTVIVIRMPTSGAHWELDEARYPKHEYWDAFPRRTSARAIHFKDQPTLAGFACPEGSHLDARDAPAFTAALAELLTDPAPLAESR
jgi:hypothetical protein